MNLKELAQTVFNDVSGNVANTSIGNYIATRTSTILNSVTEAISSKISDESAQAHDILIPLFNELSGFTNATAIQFNTGDLVDALNNQTEVVVSVLKNNQDVVSEAMNTDYLLSVVNDFVSESNAIIDIAGCLESNGNDVDLMMKIQNLSDAYNENSAGYELFNRIKKFVSLNTSGDKMAALRQLVVSLLSNDTVGYSTTDDVATWTQTTLTSDSTGASPFKAWAASVDLTINWSNVKSKIETVFVTAYKCLQSVANTIAKGILTGVRKIKESTSDPLIYKSTDKSDFNGLNTPLITWRIHKNSYGTFAMNDLLNSYVSGCSNVNNAIDAFDENYIYEFSVPGAIVDIIHHSDYLYIGYRPKLYSNHMGIYDSSIDIWRDISKPSDFVTEATQSAVSNWNGTPYQWPIVITVNNNNPTYSDSDDHRYGFGLDSGTSLFKDFTLCMTNMLVNHQVDSFVNNAYTLCYTDTIPYLKFSAKVDPNIGDVISNIASKTTANRSWTVVSGDPAVNLPAWRLVNDDFAGICYEDNYQELYDNDYFDPSLNSGKLANYMAYPFLLANIFAMLKETEDFFPYSKGYMMSQGSVDFMTDQDQASKFSNLLKGVGIGIVTVVAAVVIMKTYRKYTNKLAATRGQLWTELGSYDGSQEKANLIRKLTWKEKALSAIMGKASSVAASSGAVLSTSNNFNTYGKQGIDYSSAIYKSITGSDI